MEPLEHLYNNFFPAIPAHLSVHWLDSHHAKGVAIVLSISHDASDDVAFASQSLTSV